MDKVQTKPKGITQIIMPFESIIRALGLTCGVICLLIALLVASGVVARYWFNQPLGWTFELNNFMFVAMVFLAAAFTLQGGGHVKIDILYIRLSRRTQLILDLCTSVLALSFLCWLDWLVFSSALHSLSIGETSVLQSWPMFPVRLLLPIGTTLFIIQLLIEMGRDFTSLKKLREG